MSGAHGRRCATGRQAYTRGRPSHAHTRRYPANAAAAEELPTGQLEYTELTQHVEPSAGQPAQPRHVSGAARRPRLTRASRDGESFRRQLGQAQALVECSRALMASQVTEEGRRAVLQGALEHLRTAADVDRAFLFRNLDDGRVGPASVIVAEAIPAHAPSRMPEGFVPILGALHPDRLGSCTTAPLVRRTGA